VIIGNSCAQACTGNMKHNLKDSYKTSGFVKPRASIDTLIASATGDIEYSANKDKDVFWEVQMMLAKIIPKVD
jgi:hypothetical protein